MDDAEVAVRLLERLREAFDRPALDFARRPVRFSWGVDATLYGFRLTDAPVEASGPLVLRLFPRDVDPDRARREAALQRALVRCGYPAPAAHAWGTLGEAPPRAFVVMDRLHGRTFMDVTMGACAAAITASVFGFLLSSWTAVGALYVGVVVRWMRRLHGLPVDRLAAELETAGVPAEALGIEARLDEMERRIHALGAEGLRPGLDWLRERLPDRGTPVMCHGDFWPGNVMFGRRGVSGVIDWGDAALAPREFDLAWSEVAFYSGLGVSLPAAIERPALAASRPLVWMVLSLYRAAYGILRPLDPALMRYFIALHCLRVLLYAAERRALDALEPGVHAQHPWTFPDVIALVERRFRRLSDVTVSCGTAP